MGRAIVALLTTTLEPVTLDLTLDWRIGLFAVAMAGGTAVLFSAAPVVLTMTVDPGPSLKAGSRQVSSQGRGLGRPLVAVQMALSVVLLLGAALFARSLAHLLSVDPGFEPDRLLIARIDPSQLRQAIPSDERTREAFIQALQQTVLDSLGRTSEALSVSLSRYPPVSDEDGSWTASVGVDGAAPDEDGPATFFNAIAPGYFATLGTTLIAGRDFTRGDSRGAERVVIVNQTLAERFFSGQNPLGRRVSIGRDPARANLTIVGVVSDTTYQRLQEATHAIAFLPYLQAPELAAGSPFHAVIRVATVSEPAAAAVQAAISAAQPGLTPRIERLDHRIRESLVNERLLAVLAAALALGALFLACAGLFGLMAHMVARQTREIGIRIALGASARAVLNGVLAQSLGLAVAGVSGGLAIGWGAGGWIGSVLHGVSPTDPVAFVAVAVIVLSIALCASVVPARRAASVDPVVALKTE